jgi:hypothetical protein
MKNRTPHLNFLCSIALIALLGTPVFGQTKDTVVSKRISREDIGIVKSMTIMPYATLSFNLQSGQAFPKSAQGVGYGFGLAFDLTEDKQPIGAYFDFAYQDMRASAADGSCARLSESDTVSQSVNVTHYFSYAVFEGFVKLQSLKNNGYFLFGASAGLATTGLTVRDGAVPEEKYSEWKTVDTYHAFRLDIRAGLGIKLGYISGHQLVFEARFGYPVTSVIGNFHDFCNGTDAGGPWRVVTLQGNIGLRL